MRAIVIATALVISLVGFPSSQVGAQEPSSDGFSFDTIELRDTKVPGARCHVSDRYIVVERERTQRLGSEFFIRTRAGERCEPDSLPGDLVRRDEWAAYFSALQGDALLLDSGTGPDIRGLIIFDLRTRQKVAELSYVDLIPGPDSLTIGVWDGAELDQPLPGCPEPPGGMPPGVDSLHYVNIRTGSAWFSGRVRCAYRQ